MSISLKMDKCPLDGGRVRNNQCALCGARFNVDRRSHDYRGMHKKVKNEIKDIFKWERQRGWEK